MKKTNIYLFLAFLLLWLSSPAFSQQYKFSGQVLSAKDSLPITGAVIRIESQISYRTNDQGKFLLDVLPGEYQFTVTYVGYETKNLKITIPQIGALQIFLNEDSQTLTGVEVISTGYQVLPKERATGSFTQIDNALLNRTPGSNILSRLSDVVPGLTFNRNTGSSENSISIRGLSTINSNAEPLIILNNFPFSGDINSINPNDVQSISVLKDAAATSIWGARAGNGVIVITTKQGNVGKVKIDFGVNTTFGEKPDLFDQPTMSAADYIETEKALFAKGYYRTAENSDNKSGLSPVVELLIAKRDGTLAPADAELQIEALKKIDIRKEISDDLLRKSVTSRYNLNISGGSEVNTFYIGLGYDRDKMNTAGNSSSRISFSVNNEYQILKNKLELSTKLSFAQLRSRLKQTEQVNSFPYTELRAPDGQAATVVRNYRRAFIDQSQQKGLLDWHYRPLQEIQLDGGDTDIGNDYRAQIGLTYKPLNGFSVTLLYHTSRTNSNNQTFFPLESYYTRNLINYITSIAPDGSIVRPIPLGGILDLENRVLKTNNLRSQATFNKNWGTHSLNIVGGAEINGEEIAGQMNRTYGYDTGTGTGQIVDYTRNYTSFVNPSSTNNQIRNLDKFTRLDERFISYYSNVAYSLNGIYTLSASTRFDQSNLFGVATNQKGVPLWSAGMGWLISGAEFYQIKWLNYLKLRMTYGVSGNVNKSVSAYTTARYIPGSLSQVKLPSGQIINPPNPDLRWERNKIINIGTDYATSGNRISGSLEWYSKQGVDLIGTIPYLPSSGFNLFTGNTANLTTKGMDLAVNTKNTDGIINWTSNFLFSYARDRVTRYQRLAPVASYLNAGVAGGFVPMEGNALYGLYSYKWSGLDPANGDPMGYLNELPSKDYTNIIAGAAPQNIIYHGSMRPTIFGALRNNLSYQRVTLSINLNYRLGYYFRNESIQYNDNLGLGGHGDYYNRWQSPGDENHSYIPSLPQTPNSDRDRFYKFSEILVSRGDHIRLQDIRLSYRPKLLNSRTNALSNFEVFAFANNVGIIWRENKLEIDPDYSYGLPVFMLSAGLRLDLN